MREINAVVAKNLIELRKNKKLTQLELAEKLSVSDKSVSKWENGNGIPSIEVFMDLAELYGVTVDYILHEGSEEEKKQLVKKPGKEPTNKLVIALLAVSLVWIIACILYLYVSIFTDTYYWMCFLWSVPVSCILLIIFNGIWGKRKYTFWLSAILSWSLLTCVYLQLIELNLWLIFILGIPIQISIILWAKMK